MKQIALILGLVFYSCTAMAHSSSLSAIMLVAQDDGTWNLQVRASLQAFKNEVRIHFVDCPYESKQVFKQQLIEHVRNTLQIYIGNSSTPTVLKVGATKLGHETVVLFKGIEIPETFSAIRVKGTIFQEIYNSRTKLFILNNTLDKTPFLLSKANNFTANLHVNGKSLELVSNAAPATANYTSFSIAVLSILAGLGLFFYIRKANIHFFE